MSYLRLVGVLPELAAELINLLEADGAHDLASQVQDLPLVDRCRCGDSFCASFFTAPLPRGAWGPGHENVPLDPEHGWFILDLVDRKIVCIEILYRDEIRNQLLALLP